MTKSEKIQKAHKEYRALIEETGKEALVEAAMSMFERFTNLESVKWTQGTPSFNDGDPCTFRINECKYLLAGDDDYSDDSPEDKKLGKALCEFDTTLNSLEDVCKEFGEMGAEVTITRDGKIESDWWDMGY